MKKIYHVKVVLVMFFCALLVSCVGKTEKSKGDIWERCNVVASWQVVNGDSLLSCDFSAARQKIQLPLSSIRHVGGGAIREQGGCVSGQGMAGGFRKLYWYP